MPHMVAIKPLTTLFCYDWVGRSGQSCPNVFDPCRTPVIESQEKCYAINTGTLVNNGVLDRTGAWISDTWSRPTSNCSIHSDSQTVVRRLRQSKDFLIKMSSGISHCLILLMKPIWDLENPKQESSELEETKKEFIGSVHLKLLHLEGVDNTELIAVKSTLRQSATPFQNVTESDG